MARPDLSLPIPAHFCNIAVQAAAAEVLALIQSRPTSPWPHEIEAILSKAIAPQPLPSSVASSPPPRLAQDIRATIARLHEAWDVLEHLVKGPEFHVAEADVEALTDELRALEEQLFPPSSCGDLVLLAEIARCGAGVVNGRMVRRLPPVGRQRGSLGAPLQQGRLRLDEASGAPGGGADGR